jgi:enoyl-CoA hydratase/carnithine racemase
MPEACFATTWATEGATKKGGRMDEPGVSVKVVERGAGARIAHVTVDNRKRLNCLSTPLVVALRDAFERLAEDVGLRAVVLTGAGDRAFIGGADLNELGGLCADSGRLYITRLHMACKAIRNCPVPVIARVNGFCLGAGLEVAASADMRVVAEGAVLGMPEVVMGLPSVIEAALLPGLIGWGKTREILLTGETFGAAEALAMGFAQKVAPAAGLDAAVEHWLALLLKATPQAVRSQKALMNRWQRVSVDEGIYAGIDALSDAYRTGEPQAAIREFFAAKAAQRNG